MASSDYHEFRSRADEKKTDSIINHEPENSNNEPYKLKFDLKSKNNNDSPINF